MEREGRWFGWGPHAEFADAACDQRGRNTTGGVFAHLREDDDGDQSVEDPGEGPCMSFTTVGEECRRDSAFRGEGYRDVVEYCRSAEASPYLQRWFFAMVEVFRAVRKMMRKMKRRGRSSTKRVVVRRPRVPRTHQERLYVFVDNAMATLHLRGDMQVVSVDVAQRVMDDLLVRGWGDGDIVLMDVTGWDRDRYKKAIGEIATEAINGRVGVIVSEHTDRPNGTNGMPDPEVAEKVIQLAHRGETVKRA